MKSKRSKRKSLAKKLFDQAVKERLPGLLRDPGQEKRMGSDTLVYRSDLSSELTIFVLMQLSSKRGCFTIEGAWSDDGAFPIYATPLLPEENSGDPEGRIRIGCLLDSDSYDHWWWLRNHSSVPMVVDQAVSDLEEYLMPFLLNLDITS